MVAAHAHRRRGVDRGVVGGCKLRACCLHGVGRREIRTKGSWVPPVTLPLVVTAIFCTYLVITGERHHFDFDPTSLFQSL